MSFENRSDSLIELLTELNERDLDYVLVGGYAVSAFNTRFSTDLDIAVVAQDRELYRSSLYEHDFEQVDSHEMSWFYDSEVVEFEKRLALNTVTPPNLLEQVRCGRSRHKPAYRVRVGHSWCGALTIFDFQPSLPPSTIYLARAN